MAIRKIVLASNNAGKIRELNEMLKPLSVEVVSSGDLGVSEVEETEDTFEGNALLKARETARQTNLLSLADDSGLCVHCLDGRPGVYTARSYDSKTKGYPHAFEELNKEIGEAKDRSAHFECCIAVAAPSGKAASVTGQVSGTIVRTPRYGEGKGFGYDPLFVPDGYNETFAELSPAEKNKISHRGIALRKMLALLQEKDGSFGF